MNLNDYFDPVSLEKPENNILDNPAAFCRNISIHTPNFPIRDLDLYQLAILGVPEERGTLNEGCDEAPDHIRNKLYQLIRSNNKLRIIDLGNIKAGGNPSDTLIGLRDVLIELVERGICTLVLGGAQHLTVASTLALEKLGKAYHLSTIDSHFDFQVKPQPDHPDYYLNDILQSKSNLLSYTNLGHQQYFAEKEQIEFLDNQYHHYIRLGSLRSSIREAEPILRDTDILSMDIRSVRYADAPGFYNTSPNGFYGEEACQLARMPV
jgi:formiminoglutamase